MPTTRSKTKPTQRKRYSRGSTSSEEEEDIPITPTPIKKEKNPSKSRRSKEKQHEKETPLLLESNIVPFSGATVSSANPSIVSTTLPEPTTILNLSSSSDNNSQSNNSFSVQDLMPIYEVQASNPESIHDEFLQLVRDSGMETIAKDAGVISQNGELSGLKDYYSASDTISIERDMDKEIQLPQNKSNKRRKTTDADQEEKEGKKKRRSSTKSANGEKLSKGLRHFSMKVCQKVESKKATNYNEVAEELVKEFNENGAVDHKNIRRRVYDALNVLMAMNIIAKDKKDIKWLGLPTNAKQDLDSLEADKQDRIERIRKKKASVEELTVQENSYRKLIERNIKPEFANTESKINLPFIIVNTRSTTVIECEVADDRTGYFFNFSLPFEIHDDSEILKRLNF